MENTAVRWCKRMEITGVCLMAFFLPNFTTPKAIGTALFVVGALGWRITATPFALRRPDMFEALLSAMWLTAVVATLVNWPLPNGAKGLIDASRFLLIGWLIYRHPYEDVHMQWILACLIGGTVTGLGIGFWNIEYADSTHLEFHSISGVNRSAVYLALMLMIIFGVLRDKTSLLHRRFRGWVFSCAVLMIACLPIMGSRGALLGFLAAAGALSILFIRRFRAWLYIGAGLALAGVVVIALVTFYDRPAVAERTRNLFSGLPLPDRQGRWQAHRMTLSDLCRYEIARVAWAQIRQGGKLLTGLGPGNYGAIRVEELRFEEPLIAYPDVWRVSHAHNGFLTKTCEEGILGLAAFLSFLMYTLWRLLRNRPAPGEVHWSWPAAFGAVLIVMAAGMFNSVMVNETGWLAMMMIGGGMGRLNKAQADRPQGPDDPARANRCGE